MHEESPHDLPCPVSIAFTRHYGACPPSQRPSTFVSDTPAACIEQDLLRGDSEKAPEAVQFDEGSRFAATNGSSTGQHITQGYIQLGEQ